VGWDCKLPGGQWVLCPCPWRVNPPRGRVLRVGALLGPCGGRALVWWVMWRTVLRIPGRFFKGPLRVPLLIDDALPVQSAISFIFLKLYAFSAKTRCVVVTKGRQGLMAEFDRTEIRQLQSSSHARLEGGGVAFPIAGSQPRGLGLGGIQSLVERGWRTVGRLVSTVVFLSIVAMTVGLDLSNEGDRGGCRRFSGAGKTSRGLHAGGYPARRSGSTSRAIGARAGTFARPRP